MKRATLADIEWFRPTLISIHALVKRATVVLLAHVGVISYFNPRPREEGDITTGFFSVVLAISIHALVKRATAEYNAAVQLSGISIHALVKRATF